MKSLIILAHGSRREESNQEIIDLTEKVRALADTEYDCIAYSYLEVVEPSLPQAIDNCVNKGASNITVFPYFLNSGNHVKRDIPNMIKTAENQYPYCTFNVSPCIGMLEDMPKLILQQINAS